MGESHEYSNRVLSFMQIRKKEQRHPFGGAAAVKVVWCFHIGRNGFTDNVGLMVTVGAREYSCQRTNRHGYVRHLGSSVYLESRALHSCRVP
jgi:hypothetical protein